MASIEAAGFDLRKVSFEFRNGIGYRISRRMSPKVVNARAPRELLRMTQSALDETRADIVFFGLNLFTDLSQELRRAFPNVRQVLLSHGVESLDFCIEQQIRRLTGTENRFRIIGERMLGRNLLDEAEQRRWIDAVLTLSPLEVEVERWLGSSKVLWIPRIIPDSRLEMRTVNQRVGCVSTLDHMPNRDGLVKLFDALEGTVSPSFRFRLVGQPARHGAALAERYRFVEYLGPLTESELRLEAATWCCFVNPLFVYAKGCSTKLAVGMGWGLPVATTEFGARGYVWDRQALPLARSPPELAKLVLDRSSLSNFPVYQRELDAIIAKTPRLTVVGEQIRRFLLA